MSVIPQWLARTYRYKQLRYKAAIHFQRRNSWQTITQFFRLPTQYSVLAGPVVELFESELRHRRLEIVVIGSSSGEEVYSIIAALLRNRPGLDFHVFAYDISAEVLERAESAHYDSAAVLKSHIPENLRDTCMDRLDDEFVVKEPLRRFATFAKADILSSNFITEIKQGDIVFAQNLLFNLDRSKAKHAFKNIVSVMRPRSVLFCEGMDLDLRTRLTRQFGLEPLEYEIEKIHEDGRVSRRNGWPYHYWGLEPFARNRNDWRRRYSTIFLKQTNPTS